MISLSTLLITKMHTLDLRPQELILRKSGLNKPFLSRRPTALKRCTAGLRRCPGPSWLSGGLAVRRLLYVSCSLGWHARVPPSCPVIFLSVPLILLVSFCIEIICMVTFIPIGLAKYNVFLVWCFRVVLRKHNFLRIVLSSVHEQGNERMTVSVLCFRSAHWSVSLDLALLDQVILSMGRGLIVEGTFREPLHFFFTSCNFS